MNRLTQAAIHHGIGDVDWLEAVEIADWGEGESRMHCENASEPSDAEVRRVAVDAIERGDIEVESYITLRARCSLALTDAAAGMIRKEAVKAQEEADQEAFEATCRGRDVKLAAVEAIQAALRDRATVIADGYDGFGSVYLRYRTIDIRVSDHEQATGGGFNQQTGERRGEADLSYVIRSADDIPSREQVRRDVLRTTRSP